ncbi:MAG: diaminopimelate epimerase [Deltaproteobacteria bacterium]|nr:diaminopimelate epimerase [Deltaproteobacteria bacterium]
MIPFRKYHGLGNDFMVIDATRGGLLVDSDKAKLLCNRHFGVGADGILTVLPSESGAYRMHIYNADGSAPEMCGNGIRCFVKYIVEEGRVEGDEVKIETGRGVLTCQFQLDQTGKVETVTVNMGPVILERSEIPMVGEGRCVQQDIESGDLRFNVTALSVGTPHLVLFEDADISMARKRGALLETHPLFPERVNVDLATVSSRQEIDLVVWERGCGITKACGTGACASAAASAIAGKVDFDTEIKVNLPGGSLFVRVTKDLSSVWMRGPATEVFKGELPT